MEEVDVVGDGRDDRERVEMSVLQGVFVRRIRVREKGCERFDQVFVGF